MMLQLDDYIVCDRDRLVFSLKGARKRQFIVQNYLV